MTPAGKSWRAAAHFHTDQGLLAIVNHFTLFCVLNGQYGHLIFVISGIAENHTK